MLTKMGLGGTFLRLVLGLLSQAFSKAHTNGHFTKEILITHRVHRECPLSSLIFALSTQWLMEYIDAKLATGEANGIRISNNLTICNHLFVDDVGVFIPTIKESFEMLLEAIQISLWRQTQHE